MKRKQRVRINVKRIASTALSELRSDLLLIAELDEEVVEGRRKILRSELKHLFSRARAVNELVVLVTQRKWDRAVYLVGRCVYLQYEAAADLLERTSRSVHTVVPYAELYRQWSDAQVTLALRGRARCDAEATNVRSEILEANATLRWYEDNEAGDLGCSLASLYHQWLRKCVRVREMRLMIGDVDGRVARPILPPRAQVSAMRPTVSPPPSTAPCNRARVATSVMPCQMVTTPTGQRLLLPLRAGKGVHVGDHIVYHQGERRTVRYWYLLR